MGPADEAADEGRPGDEHEDPAESGELPKNNRN